MEQANLPAGENEAEKPRSVTSIAGKGALATSKRKRALYANGLITPTGRANFITKEPGESERKKHPRDAGSNFVFQYLLYINKFINKNICLILWTPFLEVSKLLCKI